MKKLIVATMVILAGCGSVTLAPSNVRTVEFKHKTNLSKSEAYIKGLAYISKSFGDSNHAIKAKDKTSGMIVVKGNVDCSVFNQTGDPNSYNLHFVLTFQTKDNKVRLLFEDLFMSDNLGKPTTWSYLQLTDAKQVKKAEPCLYSVREGFLASFSKSSDW